MCIIWVMAKTEPFLVRMEPELAALVRERAASKGLSMNEWMNRAVSAALASQAKGLTITTITKVEI